MLYSLQADTEVHYLIFWWKNKLNLLSVNMKNIVTTRAPLMNISSF